MSLYRTRNPSVLDWVRGAAWIQLPILACVTNVRAATVEVSNGVLVYTATAGSTNALVVTRPNASYTIDDPGEATLLLTPGALLADCKSADSNTVSCPEDAIRSWHVQLLDLHDVVDLSAVIEPTTIRGGPGADTLIGGVNVDTFAWLPGDGNDILAGGPGADTLDFDGSNASESFSISVLGSGFQLFRNIGNVILDANGIESLLVDTFGGDDVVSTVGLASTGQTLDGGLQTITDALVYDSDGLCAFQNPGSIQTPGREPIAHTGFETIPALEECEAVPAPTLGPAGFMALAIALGASLGRLGQRPPSDPAQPRRG